MDILPSGHFFKELQAIHDTGFLPAHLSLEDKWEQTHKSVGRHPQTHTHHFFPSEEQSNDNEQQQQRAMIMTFNDLSPAAAAFDDNVFL
ncbi:hypothetical protein DERF_007670 [Dermatophagoides farinae]|uniref:Uncharacterized protein n=1 Tax=Dermatophagoides farinae TaxID=6954 RepID=A0A922I0U7_DERFA|nr:hypothetical protein DERF_007670 [Dermatophagoides farinae]